MSDEHTLSEGAQVVALVPWQRTLSRARRARAAFSPTGRIDPRALAENDAAIASAAPLEAYYAIKQVGLADAIPVLGELSEGQIQTLFDLELWKGDALEVPDLLSWLEGFRIAGHAALVRAARALDHEALATLFRRRLLIAHVPKEDRSDPDPVPEWAVNPPPEIEPLMQTPDGRFLVAARAVDERAELEGEDTPVDEEERKQIIGLVRDLYLDEDWERAAGVLRTAMDDLGSALEEDAYRFRTGRVEDLGFPPLERALEVYGPLDPEALDGPPARHGPRPEAQLPLVHVEALGQGLLETALQALDGPQAERVESDLLATMNMVLTADRVDPGHLDAVRAALERGRAYVELGLAQGAPPASRAEAAAERLARLHPQVLFRVGYTLTLRLGQRARTLLGRPELAALGLDAWSAAERGVLEALLERRPALSRALEPRLADPAAPLDPALADATRPFGTPDEVEAARAWLEESARLVDAMAARELLAPIEEGLPEDPAEHDLDLRVATAAARVLSGGAFEVRALAPEEIRELIDGLGLHPEAPRFEGLESAIAAAGEGLDPEPAAALQARVRSALAELAEAWFPLVGQERLDLRFVEGVSRVRG